MLLLRSDKEKNIEDLRLSRFTIQRVDLPWIGFLSIYALHPPIPCAEDVLLYISLLMYYGAVQLYGLCNDRGF